jgi:hypothetical protein
VEDVRGCEHEVAAQRLDTFRPYKQWAVTAVVVQMRADTAQSPNTFVAEMSERCGRRALG